MVTASGWVVEYLVQARRAPLAQMGYVPAGFSGGWLQWRMSAWQDLVARADVSIWREADDPALLCAMFRLPASVLVVSPSKLSSRQD